jgi:hypothetical protein
MTLLVEVLGRFGRTAVLRRSAALIAVLMMGALTACSDTGNVDPHLGFKPAFLPLEFDISPHGVTVSGDARIYTFIGEFSIGANYNLNPLAAGDIYVVIEDRKRGPLGTDDIYRVQAGEQQFSAVLNGTTTIQIQNNVVKIDVTDGSISKIQLQQVAPAVAIHQDGSSVRSWLSTARRRWDAGWDYSWYTPFAFARWAYSDSTISRWYGLGFVWFLLRLAFAVVLAFLDAFLSLVFLLAQALFLFFGATGANIAWGLSGLAVVALIIGAIVDA